jgi:cytochrome c oxidase assembly protein subunit 11
MTVILATVSLSYASVPLYRQFCQATGYGGTTRQVDIKDARSRYDRRRPDRPLTIKFYSNTNTSIPWNFYPLQSDLRLIPGESTLAFYRAENPTEEDIVGIASYNVVPQKAGIYFQKIQCFCFEEQLLPAKTGADMPVYFVIDPDFADDPSMNDVDSISLFYTFFRAKDFDDVYSQLVDQNPQNAQQFQQYLQQIQKRLQQQQQEQQEPKQQEQTAQPQPQPQLQQQQQLQQPQLQVQQQLQQQLSAKGV